MEQNPVVEQAKNSFGNYITEANLSQTLKKILVQHYQQIHAHEEQPPALVGFVSEAVDTIVTKLARVINGNPYIMANWVDINVSSARVIDILQTVIKEENEKSKQLPLELTEKDET